MASLRDSSTSPRRRRVSLMVVAGLAGVDVVRILEHGFDGMPIAVLRGAFEFLEEARVATSMAGDAADLRDAEQDHVFVAVEANLVHLLDVAGLLAFVPQAFARARPEHGLAGLDRLLQRFAVHEGKHQDVIAALLLHDDRHQPVIVPLHLVEPFPGHDHIRTGISCCAMNRLASPTVCSP
uniref:Uncharacterized protein n=1 Tax=Ralstonia solanacearum TaxID=305 RepID=A0A0S4X0I1_RALSL|nr:protein of unknown function [Ralstonia solanacearum]